MKVEKATILDEWLYIINEGLPNEYLYFKDHSLNEAQSLYRDYKSRPERLNGLTLSEGFFPPPWNIDEHPEKTEGWIEFQKAMRKDPNYYGMR